MTKKKKIVIAAVSVFLALALTVSLLCIFLLGGSPAVTFRGVEISEEVYAYWQSQFKYRYMASVNGARDDRSYWSAVFDPETGRTNGENCREFIDSMVRQIMTASAFFDEAGMTVTDAQRSALDQSLEEAVEYRFDGDEDAFESALRAIGSSRRAVQIAILHEHKAQAYMNSLSLDAQQKEAYYVNNYVRVQLYFLSTTVDYYVDENGDRVTEVDEDGNVVDRTDPLTPEEKAAKEERILYLQTTLDAWSDDMTPTEREQAFLDLTSLDNEDRNAGDYPSGYSFAPKANFTQQFAAVHPEVVEAALSLKNIGEYTSVEADGGVWLILRCAFEPAGYEAQDSQDFFGDFLEDAKSSMMLEWFAEFIPEFTWDGEICARYPVADILIDFRLYVSH